MKGDEIKNQWILRLLYMYVYIYIYTFIEQNILSNDTFNQAIEQYTNLVKNSFLKIKLISEFKNSQEATTFCPKKYTALKKDYLSCIFVFSVNYLSAAQCYS